MRLFKTVAIFLCAATLTVSGCMVGPDYHPPCSIKTHSYTSYPYPKHTAATITEKKGGKSQTFLVNRDVPSEWWQLFHSKELDDLIRIGIANSPTLASAEASVKQAQEAYNISFGNALLPAVSGQLAGERQRTFIPAFGGSAQSIVNSYTPAFNVTYTLDLFGGARRQLEALQAQINNQQFQWEAAYLNLTTNIVTTAVNAASYRAQIRATREIIKLEQAQFKIIQAQFNLGGASGSDVFTQQTQLEQTIATLPPLQNNLEQTENLLAILIGSLPSQTRIPVLELENLTLPTQLPLTVPSNLARQRPDIRESEALLHAACADVGVATANLYPQINLSGSYGWGKNTPNGLFAYQNLVWNYMGQILQPIFNGGALMASKRQSVDAFQQAVAQYRQTVLQAFQNVANTLSALKYDAVQLRALKQTEITAYKSMMIAQQQLRLGGISNLVLITAQRQYQQAKIERIRVQSARYVDTATLFQALGGGWWNRGERKL